MEGSGEISDLSEMAAESEGVGATAVDEELFDNGGPTTSQRDGWSAKVSEFWGNRPGKACTPEEYMMFKKMVQVIKVAYELTEAKLAPRVWLALRGEAKQAVQDMDVSLLVSEKGLNQIWGLLDPHFEQVKMEKLDLVNDNYWNCGRTVGETMESFLLRLKLAKRRLHEEDPGTSISDMSFAQRMLRRSGLDKEKRRLVIAATGGDYDVKKIENSLLMLFRGICLLYTSPSPRDS